MPAYPDLPAESLAQRLLKEFVLLHIKEHKHLRPEQTYPLMQQALTQLRRRKVDPMKRTVVMEHLTTMMQPYIEYPGKRPIGLTDNGYAVVKAMQRLLLPYKETPDYSCITVSDIAEDLDWAVAKVQSVMKNVYNRHLAHSVREDSNMVIIYLDALGWALE